MTKAIMFHNAQSSILPCAEVELNRANGSDFNSPRTSVENVRFSYPRLIYQGRIVGFYCFQRELRVCIIVAIL